MSSEPTSALTNGDLILAVALKLGMAYYGEDGDEQAQIPIDDHDRAECQRHVNGGVRMFISDAPPTGWRWTRPYSSVALWADLAVAASRTVTGAYDPDNDQTLITANSSVFAESMEDKTIVVTVVGNLVIKRYVSATQVYIHGNHPFTTARTYSIASNGNFTLPRTFAGSFTGQINFGPDTNRAVSLQWVNESEIRRMREIEDGSTSVPLVVALGVFVSQGTNRRRYQLMMEPPPDESMTVEFSYDLHFDEMTDLDEAPPTPIAHDETIRAACIAVAERDVDDTDGPKMAYYKNSCLTNSRNIDARSGPRKLGYFGSGLRYPTNGNIDSLTRRNNVTFTP